MESRKEASVPAFGTDFVLRPSRPSLSSVHPGHPGDLALTQQWPLTLHRPVSNAQSGPGPVQLSKHGGHDFPTDASQSQVCHGEGPKRPGPVGAVSAYTTGQQDHSLATAYRTYRVGGRRHRCSSLTPGPWAAGSLLSCCATRRWFPTFRNFQNAVPCLPRLNGVRSKKSSTMAERASVVWSGSGARVEPDAKAPSSMLGLGACRPGKPRRSASLGGYL